MAEASTITYVLSDLLCEQQVTKAGKRALHAWLASRVRMPIRERLGFGCILAWAFVAGTTSIAAHAAGADTGARIDTEAARIEQQVITWRRDIHQHPELGFQEERTAALVARHLKSLGFDEVRTGVGGTGVVGILRGKSPGPVVALRADMDALPIAEQTNLPFASKAKAMWNGEAVSVMHACGHDAHVAMLMGVAQVLATMRDALPGSVMFLFQPAEEGSSQGGGAEAMLKAGVFEQTKPAAIFGLHVAPFPSGTLWYRAGPIGAAADSFHITIDGRGTHAAMPWGGTDAVSAAAQTVISLQSIVSRRIDLTKNPTMISVGTLHAGTRYNVMPSQAEVTGSIRTYSEADRTLIHELISQIAKNTAENYGTTATTKISDGYPVLLNDPALGAAMLPTLQEMLDGRVQTAPMGTGSEDFGLFTSQQVPGFYFALGTTPPNAPLAMNHSPQFTVDEPALLTGVRAMSRLAVGFLQKHCTVCE
ncbi:MAG: amidohydrolase [Steroidobacteraceae bacterium]